MVTERLGYADYQPGRVGSEARDNGARESELGKGATQDLREWEGVPVEDRTFAALVRPPGKLRVTRSTSARDRAVRVR
jgi:hypothetical protein